MSRPLTVRVTLVITVDRDRYDLEYFEKASAADVREYVKSAAVSATEYALQTVDAKVEEAR